MTSPGQAVNPETVLSRFWGYDSFRPRQREIIDAVTAGYDTLGLLPTGGGKSITFQVPALMLPGLTVVVTPLISLMKDQVDNLAARGIRAVYLCSAMGPSERRLAMQRLEAGRCKLLYISPEKLRSEGFAAQLSRLDVSLIVVDEAHCISQWGYDFRPSYLEVHRLRDTFPDAPVLALTASATPEVADDIRRRLAFRPGHVTFSATFARPNISYIVRRADHKDEMLLRVLRSTQGSAIVYVRSRRRTRELTQIITDAGISAEYYHAGLDPNNKNDRQDRWKKGEVRVMVATNAFGMGIDKPDVRTVVHFDLPSSLEEYYQESGRAGRDGLPSWAVVIVSAHDKATLSRRLNEAFPDKEVIRRVYELAGNFLNVAVGTGAGRLFEFNFPLFCSTYKLQPLIAHNSLQLLSRAGYIDYIDETTTRSRAMVVMDKHELYALRIGADADAVLQTLLRNYTGLFADFVYISESLIARSTGLTEQRTYEALLELRREGAVSYVPRTTTPFLLYTTSRELPRYIQLPLAVYEEQRERMARRLEAMKGFAFDDTRCRVGAMLEYFGESDTADCGKCDVCRSRRAVGPDYEAIARRINSLLESGPQSVAQLAASLGIAAPTVAEASRLLLDRGTARLDTAGTLARV